MGRHFSRRVAHACAATAIAVATLVGIGGAPAGAVSVGTLVLVAPAAPAGNYGVGVCPDGQNFQGWGSSTCTGGAPNSAALLPAGGSLTVTLDAGLYKAVVGTGPGAFGPEGPVAVVAGRSTTCTLSMSAVPSCVLGPVTGTVVVNVGGTGGSYASGLCLAPGQPVLGSTLCSDNSSANVRFGLTGGSTTVYSLVPGTYTGGLASLSPLTAGAFGPIFVTADQTATCTFTMGAAPSCMYSGGVSLTPAVGGGTVALTGATGTSFTNVTTGPAPGGAPAADFPVGVIGFDVTLPVGDTTADVVLELPPGTNPTGYLKVRNGVPVDFTANTTIVGDTVTLHLVDGDAFDTNPAAGVIGDPGGPIVGYSFGGFGAPIDNGAVNVAKSGQAVPVKWAIVGADGTPVSDPASFVSLRSGGAPCTGGSPDDIEAYAPGASGLPHQGNGNWEFDWKTERSWSGQCRTLTLTLADGTTHTAQFQFK